VNEKRFKDFVYLVLLLFLSLQDGFAGKFGLKSNNRISLERKLSELPLKMGG